MAVLGAGIVVAGQCAARSPSTAGHVAAQVIADRILVPLHGGEQSPPPSGVAPVRRRLPDVLDQRPMRTPHQAPDAKRDASISPTPAGLATLVFQFM